MVPFTNWQREEVATKQPQTDKEEDSSIEGQPEENEMQVEGEKKAKSPFFQIK
jgi:hypothetical protein